MNPITLTKEAVFTAARKAYEEGRLAAQIPNDFDCAYRSQKGNPCAVGAAITDEQYDSFDGMLDTRERSDVWGHVIVNKFFIIPDEDVRDIIALQQAHDLWITQNIGEDADRAKAKFEKVLYEL